MSPFISVIIVNYNAGARLQKCLQHLERQTYRDFEVLIIDNASQDGSADNLNFPKLNLQVEHAGENLGFAAGNNKIVNKASGLWLAFLNPDAYPNPDWLEHLIAGIIAYPDAKAFGCTQIDANNPSLLDGMGDVYHILGIAYRGYFGWEVKEQAHEGEVFAACGAAAIYETESFRRLGGFEERFFCYGEDVDIGYRLRLNGGKTIQLASAIVHHEGSAITGRHSEFTIYHGHRNRIWLAYKNTPFWLYWPFLPLHMLANFYLLVRTPMFGVTKPFIKAILHGYLGLGQFKDDRKNILKTRNVSYVNLAKSMVWSPFKILSRKGKVW